MKKYIPLIILNLLLGSCAIGQNTDLLKGSVMDEKSQEPLAYTKISVLQKYQGTISNESGKLLIGHIGTEPKGHS